MRNFWHSCANTTLTGGRHRARHRPQNHAARRGQRRATTALGALHDRPARRLRHHRAVHRRLRVPRRRVDLFLASNLGASRARPRPPSSWPRSTPSRATSSLRPVMIVGWAAAVLGECAAFAIGRYGGRPLAIRLGRRFGVTHDLLDQVEGFYEDHGIATVVGRALRPAPAATQRSGRRPDAHDLRPVPRASGVGFAPRTTGNPRPLRVHDAVGRDLVNSQGRSPVGAWHGSWHAGPT